MALDKRHLHHLWTKLRLVSPLYFLLLTALCAGVFVYSFRQNNLTMLKLRDAVFRADEQNGDIEGALHSLREYVYSHINTDLTPKDNSIYPPIQLKHRYERLVTAQQEALAAKSGTIYTEAQSDCERRFPAGLSGSNRIPCIQEYVESHGVATTPIPDSLYKFDFVSPRWSPDLAGWSLLATVGSFGLFVVVFATERWLRAYLRD